MNLNLLYALDAILHSVTLTAAGRLISLSQPAMSMALRRLRDHFEDDLVTTEGGVYRFTALAEALRPRVRRILRETDDAFNLDLHFDPATARQTITIAAPESVEVTFLSRVVPAIHRAAPGIDVRLMPFNHRSIDELFGSGLDVAIVPEAHASSALASLPLYSSAVAGMVWRGHPLAGARLTVDDYLAGSHAALLEPLERLDLGGGDLDPLLARRRVVVRTGLYSVLPNLVSGTDLIVTTTDWLAQYFAASLSVSLVGLPLRQQRRTMVAQWQKHRSAEPVIRWLLDMLIEVRRAVGPLD